MTLRQLLLLLLPALVLVSCTKTQQPAVHAYTGTGVPSDQIAPLTDTAYRLWRSDGTLLPLDTARVILLFPHPEVMYMEAPTGMIRSAGDTVRQSRTLLLVHKDGSWQTYYSLSRPLPPPSEIVCGVPPAPR